MAAKRVSARKRAKAKKSVSARRSAKTAAKTAAKAVAPAAGPVTLDEAKALAMAKNPKRAVRAARKSVAPPASPIAVGIARQQLDRERREERKRRIDDYKATMDIMKRRGARRPRRKSAAKAALTDSTAKGESFVPLQIFAEGDSWFDYPVPFFGGGIIPRLETRLGVPILNLAKAGDEVRFMLGVKERTVLAGQFSAGSPSGGPWDVLLFSGGGNDFVDNPMALWVKDFDPAIPPANHINQPRFSAALALVRAGYEDLITMRDQLSPSTHLVFQGYDFALPDGRGVCFLGPWLKPTFDLRRFPTRDAAAQVVKAMLQQFAAMLASLVAPKVTFINGQGTLAPKPSSWANELHPAKAGFEKFADIFHSELEKLFPDRVV
jgi:hypothetical protein